MISIAMATYNGEKYLQEQIDSILRQTLKPTEIVICDDCSTDNTWDILQRYAKRDARFKIYRNETNLGFVKNFEKAISACQGDYIALSDQDDIWTNDHIELLFDGLGYKIMSCGNALLVNESGQSLGVTYKEMELLDYLPEDDFLKLKSIFFFRSPFQGASMLFKKELVDFALPFINETIYHDRWLAIVACMTGGINYIDKVILSYRRTNNNVTEPIKKRSRIKYFMHGWLNGRVEEIDQILEMSNANISEFQKEELRKWRFLMTHNQKIRKPITIAYLLKNYRVIYSINKINKEGITSLL